MQHRTQPCNRSQNQCYLRRLEIHEKLSDFSSYKTDLGENISITDGKNNAASEAEQPYPQLKF